MVLKGTAIMIVRIGRGIISRPLRPIISSHASEISEVNKYHQVYTKHSIRYHLFQSIYRSLFTPYRLLNGHYHQCQPYLIPFRATLNELKRRLFFAAPTSSRLVLSLLGYSLLPQSSLNPRYFDEVINQIGRLLSKNINVDPLNDERDSYTRASLDDFELGRLIGYGCNAAVYEARLRTTAPRERSPMSIPTNLINHEDNNSGSDAELLSRQSSNCSSFYEDAYENLDEEERLNELTMKEGISRTSPD